MGENTCKDNLTLKGKKRTKYFFPKASANKECRSGYTFPQKYAKRKKN